MAAARRVYLYVMAFAGLMVSLYAVAGMVAVLVAQPVLQSSALLGASDLRSRTSLYLAELVVGLPIWLGHWLVAERFARRSPEERDAPERRLFLAAVLGVTAVVALFALRGLLRAVLTLPGATTAQPLVLAAITAGARLLVFGAACFGYARLRAATIAPERDRREHDAAYDLAIYALAGFALAFLLIGVGQAVRQLLLDLLQLGRPRVLVGAAGAPWTVWGPIAAWVLAGGAVWAPVWQYDLARGGKTVAKPFPPAPGLTMVTRWHEA